MKANNDREVSCMISEGFILQEGQGQKDTTHWYTKTSKQGRSQERVQSINQ